MSLLVPSLARAYRNVDLEQVQLSSDLPGKDLETDLISLGGRKTNAITGQLLDRIPDLPFSVENTMIRWQETEYEGIVHDGRVVQDFGYVVRSDNPFAPGRRIVVVAGSHTYGTVAAARWLAEAGGSKDIPANTAILVKADVLADGHVGRPTVVQQVALR